MNPLFLEIIGSFMRWVLAFGAGYLVNTGIWTQEEAAKYVTATAMALAAIIWSLIQKYRSRQKLVTALATPELLTEKQVETKIATGPTPSTATPKDEVPK